MNRFDKLLFACVISILFCGHVFAQDGGSRPTASPGDPEVTDLLEQFLAPIASGR